MTPARDFDDITPQPTQDDGKDSVPASQSGPADELAASILEPIPRSPEESRLSTPTETAIHDKQRTADILFVNALLEQALNPKPEQREARIQRAMAALTAQIVTKPAATQPSSSTNTGTMELSSTRRHFPRPKRLRTAWVTAFLVLIAAGLWFQVTDRSRQARAAVDLIQRVAAQATDREYEVTLTLTPTVESGDSHIPHQMVGDLFVRGAEAFAFRTPAVIGPGKIWLGGGAKGFWLKPARGPIVFQATADGLLQRYLRQPVETPFLQITTVLQRLSEHYEIKLLKEELVSIDKATSTEMCRHIQGKCRSRTGSLPDTIDVWSARDDGNVLRLILNWEHESRPGLLHVEFNFVRQADLPPEWYRPEGHPRGIQQ